MRLILAIPMVALVAGCSITQKVDPVGSLEIRDICIIEDPAVRSGFLEEYKNTMAGKGYSVTILPKGSGRDSCELTSTYFAKWSWDLAIYMSLAEIKVYHRGALSGEAFYDSRSGGGRLDKFVDGESKVRELVNQLFPG